MYSLQDCEEVFRFYETEYAKMLERWEKVNENNDQFVIIVWEKTMVQCLWDRVCLWIIEILANFTTS